MDGWEPALQHPPFFSLWRCLPRRQCCFACSRLQTKGMPGPLIRELRRRADSASGPRIGSLDGAAKAAQNPLQRRHWKYLNLRGQKIRGFAAHKLVFVGVASALRVGDVRNTAHGPGIGSEPTTLRLTVAGATLLVAGNYCGSSKYASFVIDFLVRDFPNCDRF
jgi:hypothetical protein